MIVSGLVLKKYGKVIIESESYVLLEYQEPSSIKPYHRGTRRVYKFIAIKMGRRYCGVRKVNNDEFKNFSALINLENTKRVRHK